MYYLTHFKYFVSIFSFIFYPIDPFFIDLRSFDPSFLQNLTSDWIPFFSHAEPGYQIFGEVPPPHGQNHPKLHKALKTLHLSHEEIKTIWACHSSLYNKAGKAC